MATPIQQIEKLRTIRATRTKDASIDRLICETASHAAKTHKKLGELIALWDEVVPPDLAAHTSISSLRAGVLHVVVDSSSAMFELDRMLRNGLTQQLQRNFRGTLVRVKTRIGQMDLPPSR